MTVVSRRSALGNILAIPASILAGVALFDSEASADNASWPQLKVGDLLLTRNGAWSNPVPGYFNHAAIYDGRRVIEAQIGDNSVKATPLLTFFNTYPTIVVLRHISVLAAPVTAMGQHSTSLVGQRYVSIRGWLPRVFSCVSLIRVCYMRGFAVDPGFNIPDHINRSGLFRTVGWK